MNISRAGKKVVKGSKPPLRALKKAGKETGRESNSVADENGAGQPVGKGNAKSGEKKGVGLYNVEKEIRRAHREIGWNTKEGHTRTKIKFLNAVKEERHEEALDLIYVLLDYDPMNEMFQVYRENLEGLVKNLADAGEESEEEEDIEEDDSEDDDSDEVEEFGGQGRNDVYASDDQAEKKDDDSLARSYGVDTGAKHTDDIDPNFLVDEMNPTAGMTPTQVAKFDELRAQFSSLRAAVADKNELDSKLWTAPPENLDEPEEAKGDEGGNFFS